MPNDRRIPPRQPPSDERRVGLNRGREPLPSADSFRPVPPGQEGEVFKVILAVEERLGLKLDQQTADLLERHEDLERRVGLLEKAVLKVEIVDARLENMTTKLDRVLESDRKQNEDILSLKQRKETAAIAEATTATAVQKAETDLGRKLNWRTLLGLIATAVTIAIAEWIKKQVNQ